MSNAAWCDLNSKGDTIILQDICRNQRRKIQKQSTFIQDIFKRKEDQFKINYN